MSTILEEITARKRLDLERTKAQYPTRQLYQSVEQEMETSVHHSFSEALLASSTGIIAEFKRKSPSLGWIKEEAQPEDVVPSYIQNGATALSILTDEPYFGGRSEFIVLMRPKAQIPILRKDFIIDEYQVFEAKHIGADAILLIAACLSRRECNDLARMARSLQLDVLLEIHDEAELDYISEYTSVVGVNNRNLHLFKTDIQTSFQLSHRIPQEFVKISESGLKTIEDLLLLRAAGFNGFLMGERFMKQDHPGQALGQFISQLTSASQSRT